MGFGKRPLYLPSIKIREKPNAFEKCSEDVSFCCRHCIGYPLKYKFFSRLSLKAAAVSVSFWWYIFVVLHCGLHYRNQNRKHFFLYGPSVLTSTEFQSSVLKSCWYTETAVALIPAVHKTGAEISITTLLKRGNVTETGWAEKERMI